MGGYGVDKGLVVPKYVGVETARLGLKPGPRYREAESPAAQFGCQFDILWIPRPEVGRAATRRLLTHSLPDVAHVFELGVVSLALMVCGGHAKEDWRAPRRLAHD